MQEFPLFCDLWELARWYNSVLLFNRRGMCWNTTCTDTYVEANIYSLVFSVRHKTQEAEEGKRLK